MHRAHRLAVTGLAALPLLATPTHAAAERAFNLLKNKEFKAAYRAVLGKFRSEKWVAELPGPSTEGSQESIDSVVYEVADSCKPHDCSDENLIVAYSSSQSKVYVLLKTKGKTHVLGNPSSAVRAILEREHRNRFNT